MGEQEYVEISGSVEDITFQNGENGFTVLDLNVSGTLVCVVGTLTGVQVGEELKLTGFYQNHPTYGSQFKAQVAERHLPATEGAICKYLSSGAVKGIGPVTARRIVEHFKADTLKVIEETPELLTEVSGISKEKAEKLAEEFKQVFGVRSLMLYLSAHHVNAMQSVMIYKKWGSEALSLIKENPYLLCSAEIAVAFSLADEIAKDSKIPIDSPLRIAAGIRFVLSHNLNNGHTSLPKKNLLPMVKQLLMLEEDKIENQLEEEIAKKSLYSLTGTTELIFLPVFYTAQSYIVSRIQLMLNTTRNQTYQMEEIIALIEQERGIRYESLQRKAIACAVENDVFILTGGPGTGKTTTLNGIIEAIEQGGKSVAIAAPTGRAAKRISEVTGREAKTIHRLLEVSVGYAKSGSLQFVHNEQNPLEADAVIIDEMSMVDTLLFDSLLRGMKAGAKLIMVGDYHQLPSVGAGNLLHDLIESDLIPTVRLTQIFRQAAQSLIVTNAHSIVEGKMPDLSRKDNDFFFMPQSDPIRASALIMDLCSHRLPDAYKLSPFDDIQVLCPSKKGEMGVIALNHSLQERLNPKVNGKPEFKSGLYLFRSGDKVMQIKNNYDIPWTRGDEKGSGIFNGDIGLIRMIDKGSKTMAVEFDGRVAYYTFEMSNELELAYAVTVHKSQGSEFEAIVLPIMGGFDKLYYRNLLYTAVTRAKRYLILVGERQRIEYMVKNNRKMLRYTGLKAMLERSVLSDV